MLKRFAGLSALRLRDGPLAAGCVGTAGTEGGGRATAAAAAAANIDDAGLGSNSESRVRDFERNDGGVSTSVTPAAVCVGIGGERESDSRERDFERSR